MNFKFLIVSKDDKFLMTQEDFNKFSNVSVKFVQNNTVSISKVYNNFLQEIRAENNTDIVVFMHADVKLNIESLLAHIESCNEKYDVMGLCGTEYAKISTSPLNWYTSSQTRPDKRWGCVTHIEVGNQTSYFSGDRKEITDHSVALIDGLCIIFGKNAINSEIKFDEQFLFDQYDTDISLQTVLTYKLRLGCIVEPSLIHNSIGMSITKAEFLEHEKDLRKKWNF